MTPLAFYWSGKVMVPLIHRAADQQFTVGEVYSLAPHEDRSSATHNHEFAWLQMAWTNLPEAIADAYPSAEHLRKRALVEAGYYTEELVDAGTNAAALRVAAFARGKDEFAVVIVRGPHVIVRSPKSQSRRAMDRREFAASKAAIMDVVAKLIGVTPEALQHAEAA